MPHVLILLKLIKPITISFHLKKNLAYTCEMNSGAVYILFMKLINYNFATDKNQKNDQHSYVMRSYTSSCRNYYYEDQTGVCKMYIIACNYCDALVAPM